MRFLNLRLFISLFQIQYFNGILLLQVKTQFSCYAVSIYLKVVINFMLFCLLIFAITVAGTSSRPRTFKRVNIFALCSRPVILRFFSWKLKSLLQMSAFLIRKKLKGKKMRDLKKNLKRSLRKKQKSVLWLIFFCKVSFFFK